jgi:hypothetical protein
MEAGGPDHLRAYEGTAERQALDRLDRIFRELPPEGDPFAGVSERVRDRLRPHRLRRSLTARRSRGRSPRP